MQTTTTTIRLRPLCPGETATVDAVFDGLSPRSRHLRFHGPRPRLTQAMRDGLTAVDGHRHLALVAEAVVDGVAEPIGLGRTIGDPDEGTAEIAFEVVDAWHGHGIGRRLVSALRRRAVDLGYVRLRAHVMYENRAALALLTAELPDAVARRDGMAWVLDAALPARPAAAVWALAV